MFLIILYTKNQVLKTQSLTNAFGGLSGRFEVSWRIGGEDACTVFNKTHIQKHGV